MPWLGELTRRLAARLRTDRWDHQLWQLVAELVTRNGIEGVELPVTDGFVLGWMRAPRPDRRLADTLAADPFLEVLAPKLFEVDGARQHLAWSAPTGMPPEASWPLAVAALAAYGRLPRAVLLDRCLGRLLRGGRPTELRGFLLLHQALDPDLEEVAAGAGDYCRLLADGHAGVARAAQRALRRLDDAGRLEPDLLVEASRAAPSSLGWSRSTCCTWAGSSRPCVTSPGPARLARSGRSWPRPSPGWCRRQWSRRREGFPTCSPSAPRSRVPSVAAMRSRSWPRSPGVAARADWSPSPAACSTSWPDRHTRRAGYRPLSSRCDLGHCAQRSRNSPGQTRNHESAGRGFDMPGRIPPCATNGRSCSASQPRTLARS